MTRIAVIPGDGIGVDVTAEAVKVIRSFVKRQRREKVKDYNHRYYVQVTRPRRERAKLMAAKS